MPLESGETRRTVPKPHGGAGSTPADQEQLPCPRCNSTNTKFCYYNNYNFSQPRHFCKSCRRYWTHGGTLRDIPVGGGSRKTAKRSRTCSSAPTAAVSISAGSRCLPLPDTPVIFSSSDSAADSNGGSYEVKGNALSFCGSFTSMLNSNAAMAAHGPDGHFGFSEIGLGLGPSYDDVAFGLGRAVWQFSTAIDNGGPTFPMPATWQLEGLEGSTGFVAGEYFTWPELAISTPAKTLK